MELQIEVNTERGREGNGGGGREMRNNKRNKREIRVGVVVFIVEKLSLEKLTIWVEG